MIYRGGCHCGAVRFEVEASERPLVQDCNCSLCAMTGFLHLIVPKSKFRLLKGEGNSGAHVANCGLLGWCDAIAQSKLSNIDGQFSSAIQGVVGTVPVAGDAFDVLFRANMRNARLLRRWLARQPT